MQYQIEQKALEAKTDIKKMTDAGTEIVAEVDSV
jgi:hypothetical protein